MSFYTGKDVKGAWRSAQEVSEIKWFKMNVT
jgi:hypothetical protein